MAELHSPRRLARAEAAGSAAPSFGELARLLPGMPGKSGSMAISADGLVVRIPWFLAKTTNRLQRCYRESAGSLRGKPSGSW